MVTFLSLFFFFLFSLSLRVTAAHFHHVIELLRFRQGTVSGIFLSAGNRVISLLSSLVQRVPPVRYNYSCLFVCVLFSVPVLLHCSIWSLYSLYIHQDRCICNLSLIKLMHTLLHKRAKKM